MPYSPASTPLTSSDLVTSDIMSCPYVELSAYDVLKLVGNTDGNKAWVFVEHTLHGSRSWLVSTVCNRNQGPSGRIRMARVGGAVKHRNRHMLFTHASFLKGQAPLELLPVAAEESRDVHCQVSRRGYLCCPATLVVCDDELEYALFEVEGRCLKNLPRPLANATPLNPGNMASRPRRRTVKILATASDGGEIHGRLSRAATAYATTTARPSKALYTATFDHVLDPSAYGTWILDKETDRLFGHVVDYQPEAKLTLIMPSRLVFQHALAMLDPQLPVTLQGVNASGAGTVMILRRVDSRLVNRLSLCFLWGSVCSLMLGICLIFVDEDATFLIFVRRLSFYAFSVSLHCLAVCILLW
ncbi:hypothetical protein J3F83DRAFT_720027 [Trichoderma novae-zelandiae]